MQLLGAADKTTTVLTAVMRNKTITVNMSLERFVSSMVNLSKTSRNLASPDGPTIDHDHHTVDSQPECRRVLHSPTTH